jgi:hypothetical protein
MQINTDLAGLLGITLSIITLLVRAPRVRTFPLRQRASVLMGIIVLVSIPLSGLSLAGFVRSITGDLSISTLLLLALALARSLSAKALVEDVDRLLMLRVIAIAAIAFYPFALGFSTFDPYRLGYGNLWFMAFLLGFAIWSVLRYSQFLALCIALAVAAWSAGWYESPNLWDYLLDPWLAIYAIVAQGKYWWAQRRRINA